MWDLPPANPPSTGTRTETGSKREGVSVTVNVGVQRLLQDSLPSEVFPAILNFAHVLPQAEHYY